MEKDYDTRISHLNDLITLARIDGNESLNETNFINWVAYRLKLRNDDVERIKANPEPVKFRPGKMEKDNIERFHSMVMLMGIDKKLAREEVNYCVEMGIRMGLNIHAIMETIATLSSSPNHIIHLADIETIFRKYSN